MPAGSERRITGTAPFNVPVADSVTVTSTTAVQLPSVACVEVELDADSANTVTILLGGSAKQVIPLLPGAVRVYPVDNLNRFWVKLASAGSATLHYLART